MPEHVAKRQETYAAEAFECAEKGQTSTAVAMKNSVKVSREPRRV